MDDSLEGLFTSEEYEEQQLTVGDTTLKLKVLPVASTDFDLTGQVVWPGAKLLAEYLFDNRNITARRTAGVEIGSGLGLAGIFAAQTCDLTLTDHIETVLRVLRENAAANLGRGRVRCELMDWESAEDVFRIRSLSSLEGEVLDLSFQASQDQDPEENLAGTKMKASDLMRTIEAPCYPSQGFDLVLGADICYGLRALPFIFRAYKILLASTPDALGLLGYVSRAAAIDRGLLSTAQAEGLEITEVRGQRRDVGGGLEGTIFQLRKKQASKKGASTFVFAACAILAVSAATVLAANGGKPGSSLMTWRCGPDKS